MIENLKHIVLETAFDEAFKDMSRGNNLHDLPLAPSNLSCIIMDKSKIVSKGCNMRAPGKTHNCTCHAEMSAISQHIQRLRLTKQFKNQLKFDYLRNPVENRTHYQCIQEENDSSREGKGV